MTSLEITRNLAAPVEQVWRAFTEPAALASWFWPHLDNTVETDVRVGGTYRITGPKAGIAVSGTYVEVEPPKRLVFTWQWDGEDVETRVVLELSAASEGTVLSLVHDRFHDEASRDGNAAGWNDCLDRLPTATVV
jgi:uncharacterized protein YndB with AHSA1/START domain